MLDPLISVIRLLLAAILFVSALAKLLDRAAFAAAVADYAILPRRAGQVVAAVVPWAEVTIAVGLLLAGGWVRVAALAGVLLLAAFGSAMGLNLRRGRVLDCHCFGSLHREPIGRRTLARTVGLLVLALVPLILGPGPDFLAWGSAHLALSRLAVAVLGGLTLAVAAEGVAVAVLARRLHPGQFPQLAPQAPDGARDPWPRQSGRAARVMPSRMPGVTQGVPAPSFRLPDLEGVDHDLAEYVSAAAQQGRPLLLIFSAPDCAACDVLLPAVAAAHRARTGALDLMVITRGTAAQNWLKVAAFGLTCPVLRQQEDEVAARYGIRATPAAVLLAPDGTIVAGPETGVAAIERLIAPYLGSLTDTARPAIGEPAPAVTLLDDGNIPHALAEFTGSPLLLLFFDADCPFCARMLPELRARLPAWAAGLRVIVITAAAQEYDLGPNVPVLREVELQASRAFGVSGTPGAVLLDGGGRLVAAPVVGAPAIWRLVADWHATGRGATEAALVAQPDAG